MKKLGWDVVVLPRLGIEDGIRYARMVFPRVYFDKVNASRIVDCLKRYRRHIPASTEEPSNPVHDEYSHGADNFRYICQAADQMSNEDRKPMPRVPRYRPRDAAMGS